ncbi:hypothetical protein [Paenibacillus odorifer]|nr:hypothetical protein [Paenibacillus odorifer]
MRIGPYTRDGYGVSIMNGDPAAEPKLIRTAVDQAVNEAFIDAIDTYEMGWISPPTSLRAGQGNQRLHIYNRVDHLQEWRMEPLQYNHLRFQTINA